VHGIPGRWYQGLVEVSSCCCFSVAPVVNYGRRYVLPSFRLYKGLMLKADETHKKFEL
jgi:hypothetical protein